MLESAENFGPARQSSDDQTHHENQHRRIVPQELRARAQVLNESKFKRGFDLLVSLLLIAAFLPALLLIALAIVLDSKGPVLFRQERYGRDRIIFKVYKFRTMQVAECSQPFAQAIRGDKRLTRLGRLLRRTSLDELPQLINVLKGDMSLVGPRPHAVTMDDMFAGILPGYLDRHLVPPGMTGLAQVGGCRGPTQADGTMSERLRLDRAYIETWSIWLDLKILARTPFAVIHTNAV